MRRDSGPAIVAGATFALRRGDDPVVVALAADHVVTDPLAFAKVCATAGEAALAGSDRHVRRAADARRRPNTVTSVPARRLRPDCFGIERFVEKPDAETAARYVARRLSLEFRQLRVSRRLPARRISPLRAGKRRRRRSGDRRRRRDLGFVTLETDAFGRATAKSIDYAVMERTERAAVMPVSYGWSDVGSWQAVWELSERDADGNAAQGSAVFVDTRSSYVASEKQLSRCSASTTSSSSRPTMRCWWRSRERRRRVAPGRRAAQASRASADAGPSESAPALGRLSIARSWRRAIRSSASW